MAIMIDNEPELQGEKKTWNAFSSKLSNQWIVYNTRSVNTFEYDFCVMAPSVGLFIVEVKGWFPDNVLTVVNENTIILSGYSEPQGSPRQQARGYRFGLLNKIKDELGMNPLVLSLVCYPQLSEKDYMECGLNIVSDVNETIFKEDLEDSSRLYQKFIGQYNLSKGRTHDELDSKRFALLRHYFEPNYDLKTEEKVLNPGYSRLRVFTNIISSEAVSEIIDEYFRGIKEIVFVSSKDELQLILNALNEGFLNKKIYPDKNNIAIGVKAIDFSSIEENYTIFNLEIEVIDNLASIVPEDILIEEGLCSDSQKTILTKLSQISAFNFQQYEIEHAPSDKNILITAGAGTGKTFSMVSRIAYLCNRTTDSVVDIVKDIAMITFTNDAADNMNRRVKKMFINYFVLTSNEKYMHYIEDMSQVQISTIHKFAISILQKDCMRLGIGYDSQVSSETFNRKKLYHAYLNDYLQSKCDQNPDFIRQIAIPTYEIENMLISFCTKLYDRSIDIKKLTSADFGESVASLPFFNEMVMEVAIKAEKDYSNQLKENDLIGLRECMIQIHELVKNDKLMNQGLEYKYLFVDEFQDTDDVQIETITCLQKIFGAQCHLFIVGDLKQSIYRFRGATLSAFDRVKSVQGIGEWVEYSLNRNYRTDKRLLDSLNEVFVELGEEGYLPYEEKKDRLSSRILKEYPEDSLIKRVDYSSSTEDDFYNQLFAEIKKQITIIQELSTERDLSTEEKTIAILVRYNRQIADLVKASKNNENIDFTIKVAEGGDLYRLDSSIDLYKLVQAITHPTNMVYLTSLIQSNYVSLHVNFAKISGLSEEEKTNELINILNEYFMLFIGKTWNQVVLDFQTRPVLVVLREIYDSTKPWTHYKDSYLQKEYRENYDCLIEKITRKYSREYMTINKVHEFLKINITTYQEAASRKTEGDSTGIQVICSTIHKSKGLEYGTVILPYMREDVSNIKVGDMNVDVVNGKVTYSLKIKGQMDFSGGFDDKIEEKEKTSEEVRILYVALTRTIRNLIWLKDLDDENEMSWGRFMEDIE